MFNFFKQKFDDICPERSYLYMFVCPGCTLLTGSSSLQLWSNVDGVKDEGDERGQPAEMTIRDCRSAWRCIWQSK